MKVAAARVDAFLRRPDAQIAAVLLYGPDAGLVRERADALGRSVVPDLRDPFRVVDISGPAIAADAARLADEAAQIGLMGGRRLVRVREVGDAHAAPFARLLASAAGDAMIVVEAGELPARSALRRIFEDAANAAAIGCYPDNARDLAEVVRQSLAAHRIAVSRDAVEFLA
ncbi:MAG: DNA polymerase III subunit delta, partial [Alphaproteobacteria bacterium]|nr:DNA polymerase III subunit delta [Alphaproteobacteria bacterium]